MLLWQFQTFTSWTRNPTRFSPKISKIAFSKWMSIVFYIDKFLFLKLAILGNLAVLAIFWRSWLFSAIWQFSSFQSWQHCTMLQKLSKCKVKAWLCWNLIILPPLDFVQNYILANANGPKLSFTAIWTLLIFTKKSKFRTSKNCQKWRFWTFWLCQNLISHKLEWW